MTDNKLLLPLPQIQSPSSEMCEADVLSCVKYDALCNVILSHIALEATVHHAIITAYVKNPHGLFRIYT
jgi:hypothetical protein